MSPNQAAGFPGGKTTTGARRPLRGASVLKFRPVREGRVATDEKEGLKR